MRTAPRALLLAVCLLAGRRRSRRTRRSSRADAKKAFDSGRFKEAGDKYAKAAETPGVAADRKADLHLQSAWSYYIAGNSKSAREAAEERRSTARPDLQVIPDFYSPDFANLAAAVRAEVAGSNVPADRRRRAQALGARQARRRQGRGRALRPEARRATPRDPEVYRIHGRGQRPPGPHRRRRRRAPQRAAELEKGLVSSAPIGATLEGAAAALLRPGGAAGRRRRCSSRAEKRPRGRRLPRGRVVRAPGLRGRSRRTPRRTASSATRRCSAARTPRPSASSRPPSSSSPANAKVGVRPGGARRAAEEVEHRGAATTAAPSSSIRRTSPRRAASAAR